MEAIEYALIQRTRTILQDDPGTLNRPFKEYPLYPIYAEDWYTPLVFAVDCGRVKW
jgi:hypothetical protein